VSPQVLFAFLQLQNCTGILCDVEEKKGRKKENKRERQGNVGGGCRTLCASCTRRRDGWTEEGDGRKEKKSMKEKERERQACQADQRSVSAHLCGSHSVSQPRDASHLEDFAAAATHPQRAPAAVPVLVLVISVADCTLYWCVLVA